MNDNNFKNWINSLSVGNYPTVRKTIIEQCFISEQVFRHWKCGNTKVPKLAQKIINDIAKKEVFQL